MTNYHLFTGLLLLSLVTSTQAEILDNSKTYSISAKKGELKEPLKRLRISSNKANSYIKNKSQLVGKTREEIHAIRSTETLNQLVTINTLNSVMNDESSISTQLSQKNLVARHHQFSIYQGHGQLIEDYDDDGFFQTFSVTFDPDVHHPTYVITTEVYADLFLRKNGGDWLHYHTTDIFVIKGDDELDEFEVYTTLNQGYATAHYDVLIDLYEVGYTDIVATYSSYDTNELYALPLESSEYDPEYIDNHYYNDHGGSIYAMILLLFSTILLRRFKFSKTFF